MPARNIEKGISAAQTNHNNSNSQVITPTWNYGSSILYTTLFKQSWLPVWVQNIGTSAQSVWTIVPTARINDKPAVWVQNFWTIVPMPRTNEMSNRKLRAGISSLRRATRCKKTESNNRSFNLCPPILYTIIPTIANLHVDQLVMEVPENTLIPTGTRFGGRLSDSRIQTTTELIVYGIVAISQR